MSEEQKENIQAGNPLGEASVASLMVKFAVPSIIAMIVSALSDSCGWKSTDGDDL